MSDINEVTAPFRAIGVGENYPSTVVLAAVAATSANVALVGTIAPNVNPPSQCRVYNASTAVVFVAFGSSSVDCVAVIPTGAAPLQGDQPVLPGAERVFSVPNNTRFAAAIATTGTGPVYFTLGKGQ